MFVANGSQTQNGFHRRRVAFKAADGGLHVASGRALFGNYFHLFLGGTKESMAASSSPLTVAPKRMPIS